MSIGAWIFIGVGISTLKLAVAIGYTLMWVRREKIRKIKKLQDNQRIPFVPIISWIFFFSLALMFILSSLDIANSQNSIVSCIFGISWCCFGLLTIIYLMKFISLGHRIVRTGKHLTSSSNEQTLAKFDSKGKIFFFFMLVALAGQTATYSIVAVLIPNNYTIIRIGNGLQFWFLLQVGFSVLNHFERVKNVYGLKLTRHQNLKTNFPATAFARRGMPTLRIYQSKEQRIWTRLLQRLFTKNLFSLV